MARKEENHKSMSVRVQTNSKHTSNIHASSENVRFSNFNSFCVILFQFALVTSMLNLCTKS